MEAQQPPPQQQLQASLTVPPAAHDGGASHAAVALALHVRRSGRAQRVANLAVRSPRAPPAPCHPVCQPHTASAHLHSTQSPPPLVAAHARPTCTQESPVNAGGPPLPFTRKRSRPSGGRGSVAGVRVRVGGCAALRAAVGGHCSQLSVSRLRTMHPRTRLPSQGGADSLGRPSKASRRSAAPPGGEEQQQQKQRMSGRRSGGASGKAGTGGGEQQQLQPQKRSAAAGRASGAKLQPTHNSLLDSGPELGSEVEQEESAVAVAAAAAAVPAGADTAMKPAVGPAGGVAARVEVSPPAGKVWSGCCAELLQKQYMYSFLLQG